jgi:hypothetical protein
MLWRKKQPPDPSEDDEDEDECRPQPALTTISLNSGTG